MILKSIIMSLSVGPDDHKMHMSLSVGRSKKAYECYLLFGILSDMY